MRVHTVLVAVLVGLSSTTALADPGANDNDAGSGGDVANTRTGALAVAAGSTYGGRVRGPDVDWYQSSVPASAATCVRTSGSSESDAYFALGVEESDGTTTAPLLVGKGTQATGGIAGMTPLVSTLRIARAPSGDGPGHYTFRFDRVGVPASGDGGTAGDAGNADTALPIEPGCIGGHLTAIGSLDMRDVYRLTVGAGEVVTYSLASTTGGHTLGLLDSAGEAVGPIVEPGGLASVQAPAGGTYFLSAQRTTAVGDVGYIAGVVVGPDPSGCRPYCLG